MVEEKNRKDILVFPPCEDETDVLTFPTRKMKPSSSFIAVDTSKTCGIMTPGAMSEAVDECIARVKADISTNQETDEKDDVDVCGDVVVGVDFRNKEI